jgi:phospholipase C
MTLRIPLLALACACDPLSGVPVGPRSTMNEAEAATARRDCIFTAGTLPGISLAKDAPLGPQIPIDTIVIVMMENRSFDHMLGQLAGADVAAANVSNPDSNGTPVARFHQSEYCFGDTSHSWRGAHTEWNGGKNDGFVIANDPGGARAMGYYSDTDIPFFYALARSFAVADHYHCSLLGPTEPNRMYLYAATSFGRIENMPWFEQKPTIMELLESKKVTWKVYSETIFGLGIFAGSGAPFFNKHFFDYPTFLDDARAGKLPHVVFVDPDLANEFVHSPQWRHTALFITFDEWGGLYDHVPPPAACAPDDLQPTLRAGDPPGGFDRLGFRVPLIAVSPYVKPGYVSHHTYDHTSILRFIEARFLLPALTRRDANADPMFDLFDFTRPALLTPPNLPAAAVNQQKLDDCAIRFPN